MVGPPSFDPVQCIRSLMADRPEPRRDRLAREEAAKLRASLLRTELAEAERAPEVELWCSVVKSSNQIGDRDTLERTALRHLQPVTERLSSLGAHVDGKVDIVEEVTER